MVQSSPLDYIAFQEPLTQHPRHSKNTQSRPRPSQRHSSGTTHVLNEEIDPTLKKKLSPDPSSSTPWNPSSQTSPLQKRNSKKRKRNEELVESSSEEEDEEEVMQESISPQRATFTSSTLHPTPKKIKRDSSSSSSHATRIKKKPIDTTWENYWMDLFPSLLNRYQHQSPCWQTPHRTYHSDIPTLMLHEEILDFIKFIEPTQEEHHQRQCIIASIEATLKKAFPNSHVVSFGSFDTLLYLPQSDIDLSLCLNEDPSARRLDSILTVIANCLRNSPEFMKIEVVRHAKVPIVKAVHYALGISVDISVNQVIGMTTVDTVKVWSERHPALRPLTLVLKMFFFCRELNEVFTGGISSYTLITMVYVFLDMHPLLRSHEINEQENLGVLLIEWFELFGRCFDPKLTMVTVHGFRNKSTEFIQKLRLNPNFLSILDPLNKDNDLSRGAKCTQEIRSAIEWGYDVLTQAILFSQSQSQFLFPTFLGLIFYMDEALLRKRKALMFYAEEIENQLKKFIHSGASSSSFKNKRRNDPH